VTSSLEQLLVLMPPPEETAPCTRTWHEAEAALGVRFPADGPCLFPVASAGNSGEVAFAVVSGGEVSDAEAWVGKLYADQWTAVHLSLPQLLDAALADLEAWGLPCFVPS
jgi:hypothetical protein